jgi:hypothetical protein
MNTIHNSIEEQRWAMLEMRSILNEVQRTFGANPPTEILLAIAQIAKANQKNSTAHSRKLNHTVGIEEFCKKNNISLG